MDPTSALTTPQVLTPLALVGLVVVQVMQLIRSRGEAAEARAARHDVSLAEILQKVLDQHTESMRSLAASMEKIAASMAEVQAHMHATNTVLANLTHRLELVERQLAPPASGPVPIPPMAMPRARGRAREA